jgi:phosphate:Na+ symporter
MKEKHIFFNPFRLISPTVDFEASRIHELYDTPPEEVTSLEEGLLVMCSKLIEMTQLIHKMLLVHDPAKLERCELLAKEIHDEEKRLTTDLVRSPDTTSEVLRAVVLFPGRLERMGDLLESILNVCRAKARDDILFSQRAQAELGQMFNLFVEMLKSFRDVLTTRNKALLEHIISEGNQVTRIVLNFNVAHEERLCEGLCSPKASSLYLDILDSIKHANHHLMEMCQSFLSVAKTE